MDKKFETYVFSTIYNLRDLSGNLVPDSKITRGFRDVIFSNGDYKRDCSMGVNAYFYDNGDNKEKKILLSDVDLNKYIVKYIAGLWRVREKPARSYKITKVHDKKFVLGPEIQVNEHDDFKFKYYNASLEKYDVFGVLQPEFKWFVATCHTGQGLMMRYGTSRAEARAFLRGAIMDRFSQNIANIVLQKTNTKEK